GGVLGGGRLLGQLQFPLVEPRAQHLPSLRPVAVLGTVVLAHHRDVGRDVGEADRRLRLVHVLPAGAAGAHGVDAHVRLLDVDVDAIVDHGIDVHAGERGVAGGGGGGGRK